MKKYIKLFSCGLFTCFFPDSLIGSLQFFSSGVFDTCFIVEVCINKWHYNSFCPNAV